MAACLRLKGNLVIVVCAVELVGWGTDRWTADGGQITRRHWNNGQMPRPLTL